jgi:hypothetical protein
MSDLAPEIVLAVPSGFQLTYSCYVEKCPCVSKTCVSRQEAYYFSVGIELVYCERSSARDFGERERPLLLLAKPQLRTLRPRKRAPKPEAPMNQEDLKFESWLSRPGASSGPISGLSARIR